MESQSFWDLNYKGRLYKNYKTVKELSTEEKINNENEGLEGFMLGVQGDKIKEKIPTLGQTK